MTGISPQFKDSSQKTDFDALIEFARTSTDPAAINAAMLAASDNPPFWPADRKLTGFLIAAKSDPALDDRLLEAARLSAAAREAALAASRTSDKQGAFTNFIYADAENPEASKIYKVIRARQIGGGTGAWGGLKEGEDVNVGVTVNREVYEEVIDAVKLLLKTEGGKDGEALESAFDASIHAAFEQKKPLSAGVAEFVARLDYAPALQARVQDFVATANDLIDDLVAAEKHKLFQNRDDAHAIERGWGFRVDAFAHAAGISKETAEKFDALHSAVEDLKQAAVKKGLSAVAGEMQGISIYTLQDAPQNVVKNHYGHEGLAEIAGFALLAKQNDPSYDTDAQWKNFADSGAVATLAAKMRLLPQHLKKVYDSIVAGQPDGYPAIPAADYAEAYRQKTAPQPPQRKPGV